MNRKSTTKEDSHSRRNFLKKTASGGIASVIGIAGFSEGAASASPTRVEISSRAYRVYYAFETTRDSRRTGYVDFGETDVYNYSGNITRAGATKFSDWSFSGGFDGTNRNRVRITTNSDSGGRYRFGVTGTTRGTDSTDDRDSNFGGYVEGTIAGLGLATFRSVH